MNRNRTNRFVSRGGRAPQRSLFTEDSLEVSFKLRSRELTVEKELEAQETTAITFGTFCMLYLDSSKNNASFP